MTDEKTIFRSAQVFDPHQDYYKTVWCCPICGELILALVEPPFCTACHYNRPRRRDEEYQKEVERTSRIAHRRILAILDLDEKAPSTRTMSAHKEQVAGLLVDTGIARNRARLLVDQAAKNTKKTGTEELFRAALRLHGQTNGSIKRS